MIAGSIPVRSIDGTGWRHKKSTETRLIAVLGSIPSLGSIIGRVAQLVSSIRLISERSVVQTHSRPPFLFDLSC
jgi:hypothetical protein